MTPRQGTSSPRGQEPKGAVDRLNAAAVVIAAVAAADLPVDPDLVAVWRAVDRGQVMAEARYQLAIGERAFAAGAVASRVAAGVPVEPVLLDRYRATEVAVNATLLAWIGCSSTTKKTPSDGR